MLCFVFFGYDQLDERLETIVSGIVKWNLYFEKGRKLYILDKNLFQLKTRSSPL